MSAGRARLAVPIVAVLAFAAMLGWYVTELMRPAARSDAVPSSSTAPGAPAPKAEPGAEAKVAPPAASPPQSASAEQSKPEQAVAGRAGPAVPEPKPAGAGPDAKTAAAGGQPSAAPAPGPSSQPTPDGQASRPEGAAGPEKAAGADGTEAAPKPSFDVVRVEPSGDSVIAGRAGPGATVDLLRNGQPFARAVADPSGLFAIVPPALPPGTHEMLLQATDPSGAPVRSAQSVTVVIADKKNQPPLVTIAAPDQPTVVLSAPNGPAPVETAKDRPGGSGPAPVVAGQQGSPAAGPRPPIRIATVEAETSGRLFVSGTAAPGATLRLYLNDAFVAPGGAAPDGRLAFAIERGIRPGNYRVRLDDVDPVSGDVKSRAEVGFTMAAPTVTAQANPPAASAAPMSASPGSPARAGDGSTPSGMRARDLPAPSSRPAAGSVVADLRGSSSSQGGAGVPGASPPGSSPPASSRIATAEEPPAVLGDPGTVIVPEVNTALVSRGDNLWRISKRVYGEGLRYTVIYGANTPQIRDPDLIYPGQVFVLPADPKARPASQ